MANTFRVIDTGIDEGRRNIAFDQALIDAHVAGEIQDTIRFLRFKPTALVGRHQALSREIDVDYCRENDIGLARRITGGGTIFFDEGQLGWELVFHKKTLPVTDLPALSRIICEAAADGLSTLGVDARFRPRNDIEVDGRKISGTGGFFDGDTLFFQGTVLIDTNPEIMVKALKVPAAKLAKRKLDSAAQRVVTLKELLGDDLPSVTEIEDALLGGFERGLGITAKRGDITDIEESRRQEIHDDEIGTDDFVWEVDDPDGDDALGASSITTPGGTITAYVRLAGHGAPRIQQVLITGDFFANPPRLVFDLEAAFRDTPVSRIRYQLGCFMAQPDIGTISVPEEEIERAIVEAAEAAAGKA